MLNKVVLIGRLTKDPDLRYTTSGIAVARFILAVDRGFKNQDGEKQADFIPITVWRGAAESCAKHLVKGRLVAVSGRIQTGSYDKDGQRVYTTDVVADEVRFLEWGGGGRKGKPNKMGRYQGLLSTKMTNHYHFNLKEGQ